MGSVHQASCRQSQRAQVERQRVARQSPYRLLLGAHAQGRVPHQGPEFHVLDTVEFSEAPSFNETFILHAKKHWITLSSVQFAGYGDNSDEFLWYIFDSLSECQGFLKQTLDSIKPQLAKLFPGSITLHHFKRAEQQRGTAGCGLFALAYAHSLCFKKNPSSIMYEQSLMRSHFNDALPLIMLLSLRLSVCLIVPSN